MQPIVVAHGLTKAYQGKTGEVFPLQRFNVEIFEGEVFSLLGKSGAGKTTLLRVLAGLEEKTAGGFTIAEGKKLGIVFQEPRLMPWKTVGENVALSLLHEETLKEEEKAEAVKKALKRVGLSSYIDSFPGELSGGMAQRVALARALAPNPDFLLLDEPFGALDAFTRREMQGQLIQILQETPVIVLLVTHDVNEALLLSDRIGFLKDGKIVREWKISSKREERETDTRLMPLAKDIYGTILGQER